MDADGFDWDASNWPKCRKHGVSKTEIEFALTHGARIAPDPKHSATEERFIVVSRDSAGRPVFIGVTFRIMDGRRLVRPVTARYMHAKEAQKYAAQRPENDNG